nr:hypothetical protein [Tanacetum cinerariifolium]
MNQNQIGRTVFDIDEESDAFYFQKAIEYHEWLLQQEAQPRLTRTPIFRDCEDAERRLRADYFDITCHGKVNTIGVIKKYPTIMLEAVASQGLWIWHAFYGIAGATNDINVLDNSPLFDDLLDDLAHVVPYVVNVVEYRNGYYLADGIYPEWASFIKSFTVSPRTLGTYSTIGPNKVEGLRDWNSSEYQDTTGSKGKKVMNALSFYKTETNEVSERYIALCFVNGLEAYDGEINLAFDENLISNEYAVKLCLDYEVKKGKKLVKKELIVALKRELYFVKFIINPEEDDVEPGVILGRSFIRLAKGIIDFGNGVITIYPEPDPFEDDFEKTEKSLDDWDQLLDFNFDDVPKNLSSFYQDIGPSLSAGDHLTQEEASKEALAKRISQKFALLEEVRPIIETMPYHDKYKKFLMRSGKTRLEGKVNEIALADTGSDINTMPYRIYETLEREETKKIDRVITTITHTQAEAMGILTNVLCQVGVTTIIAKFIILDIPIDRDAPIVVGRGFLYTIGSILNTPEKNFLTFDGICHQIFRAATFDVLRTIESDSDDEEEYQIRSNKFEAPIYGPKPASYLNYNYPVDRSLALHAVTNLFRKKYLSTRVHNKENGPKVVKVPQVE